jgi:hypothetical protein
MIDCITKLEANARDSYDCIMIIADPLSMQLRWNAAREKDLTAEAFT